MFGVIKDILISEEEFTENNFKRLIKPLFPGGKKYVVKNRKVQKKKTEDLKNVLDSKKSRFAKEQKASGLLSSLGLKTPLKSLY